MLNYVSLVLNLFVRYYITPLRYTIKRTHIEDLVTSQIKLFENNYKIYRTENTLAAATNCLNVIIDMTVGSSGPERSGGPEQSGGPESLLVKLTKLCEKSCK